jgi:hypothetical protein
MDWNGLPPLPPVERHEMDRIRIGWPVSQAKEGA